jgi:hypothetical protein
MKLKHTMFRKALELGAAEELQAPIGRRILLEQGIFLTPTTPSDRLRSLIARLRPLGIKTPLIRVGSSADGGYLVPDDLDGLVGMVSPGVACEASFDLEMAGRGLTVAMADASVDGPPLSHPNFRFHKKFVDTFESETTLTLETLVDVASGGRPGDLLLQMDIEGAELRTLLHAPSAVLERFRIMVIEFHDMHRLFDPFGLDVWTQLFDKLLRTHGIVHNHPNNHCPVEWSEGVGIPQVFEMTLYRCDRDSFDSPAPTQFPHPLDNDNTSVLPSIALPEIWYRAG